MDIYQLEYLVTVAHYKHFTKAAEALCVSQSTLSLQIGKLEKELGVKIFDRSTHSVLLTDAGQSLLSYAQVILDASEAAKQCMLEYVGLARGNINIGAIRTVENMGFVPLISSFHTQYPKLRLRIIQDGSYRIIEMLRESEINVGIVIPPPTDDSDNIEYYPLATDEFVLVTASNHPFASRKIIDLSEAANEDFIFPIIDQSIYNIYFQACRDAGFTPRIVCESSYSATSLALVSVGMGISFLPMATVKASTQKGVAIIKLARPIKKHVALALLKRPYHSPPVVAFRNYILKTGLATP